MGSLPDKTPIGRWPGRAVGRDNSRGIALVSVLWILALLAIIAGSFTTNARTNAKLAHNLVENAKARALADAGVNRAILALLGRERQPMLSPEMEALIVSRPELEQVLDPYGETMLRDASEQRWPADGTVYAWRFGGGEALVSIQDETGKIDLNTARDELLKGLFLSVGLEEQEAAALVDAIADFRDPDDLRRLNGAEDDDYRDAGLAYGAKDRPFDAVEELRQVMGMTRALYERVAPMLTVYSGQSGIDPRTAPREALLALPGVDGDAVEALLATRAEAGQAALLELLGTADYLSRSRRQMFTVRAEARTAGGGIFVRQAVVQLSGVPEQIVVFHAWKQGARQAPDEEESPTTLE